MSPRPEIPVDETNIYSQNPDAIIFGEKMFYDTQLSPQGISCSSCHDPDQEFTEPEIISEGAMGFPERHTPSIWNSIYPPFLNWDGSCDSLWCQATAPIESPTELNTSRVQLVHIFNDVQEYRWRYLRLFGELPDATDWPAAARPAMFDGDPLGEAWDTMSEADQQAATDVLVNVAKTLAAFQIALVTQPAPVDHFVDLFRENEGQALGSLTHLEHEGLLLFIDHCSQCHSGPLFSNFEFYNTGLASREWLEEDQGRIDGIEKLLQNPFNAQGDWSDDTQGIKAQRLMTLTAESKHLGQFKTPSLRQVSASGPYMHGGHFETLEAVLQFYSRLDETPAHGERTANLSPLMLTDEDVAAITEFLKMLRGRD